MDFSALLNLLGNSLKSCVILSYLAMELSSARRSRPSSARPRVSFIDQRRRDSISDDSSLVMENFCITYFFAMLSLCRFANL